MKYSLLLPHSCNGWLKHTTVPLVPLPALTSIISASLAHTLAFQLSMQATHTAPWDACQEQFLIKLSPCQSFPRTRVLLIFLPALSSQSNNPGSRKTRLIYALYPREKGHICLLGKRRPSVWILGLVERARQTTLEAKVISLVQPQGHQLN